MPASTELIERSGDLKGELLEYAIGRRFARAYRQAQERRFGRAPVVEEAELINFLDWFALQERLPGGGTVVEHFVTDHPELTEEERALLLGWRDVVEGIFEVQRRDGEALVVVNLVDELTYRVRSNMGPAIFRQMPRRSFIATRLVPIADEWLLSGMTSVLPAASRAEVYRSTGEFAAQHPELVFRNPEKLALARQLQQEEHRNFIAFFGADLVVLPGHEVAERMRAYGHFRNYQVLDEQGKSAADRSLEAYGVAPPELDFPAPAEFSEAETIGLLSDEVEGHAFLINFAVFEETFANPALAANREHRQAVLGYLHEPSVSPLPFRRLAERDPEQASQVFRRVLKEPGFSWERDGEMLLRRHKASFFARPMLPSITPVSEMQTRAQLAAPETPRPRPDYRPTRRGKKGLRGKRR